MDPGLFAVFYSGVVPTTASGLPERPVFVCGWGTVDCVSTPDVLLSLLNKLVPFPSENKAAVLAAGAAAGSRVSCGITVGVLTVGSWWSGLPPGYCSLGGE